MIREGWAKLWGPLRESAGHGRSEPAHAFARLIHVASLELALGEQFQDEAVYDWSDRLHQIVGQRTAVALVCVENPEPRVEAVRL
jgi:hypothetical protein